MRLLRCYAFLSAFATCVSVAYGQIGTATITGRTTDASGAVVPNVAVTVVQIDTNFQFTSVTNENGIYRIQSLQPGAYRVTFELSGFKRLVRDNIDLRVGDVLPVDGAMAIG